MQLLQGRHSADRFTGTNVQGVATLNKMQSGQRERDHQAEAKAPFDVEAECCRRLFKRKEQPGGLPTLKGQLIL